MTRRLAYLLVPLATSLTLATARADSAADRYRDCLADRTAIAQRGEHRLAPILREVTRACAPARKAVLAESGRAVADEIRDERMEARFPEIVPAALEMRVRALPRP